MKEKANERFYFFTPLLQNISEYSKSTSTFFNTPVAVYWLLLPAVCGFLTLGVGFSKPLLLGILVWYLIPISKRVYLQHATTTTQRIFDKNNTN